MTRAADLARIHIAKKALGFDDETYRAVLERITGETSSKNLSPAARAKLITEFYRFGWSNPVKTFKLSQKSYVRKIYALWGALKRDGIWREKSPASLHHFAKKITGCDNLEWLTYPEASKVIEALKSMQNRATP